jgi:hypothetical protein
MYIVIYRLTVISLLFIILVGTHFDPTLFQMRIIEIAKII